MSRTEYRKIWFSNGQERTAGVIVDSHWIEAHKKNLNSEASRLFPLSEAYKMCKFYVSEAFDSWDGAFMFDPDHPDEAEASYAGSVPRCSFCENSGEPCACNDGKGAA